MQRNSAAPTMRKRKDKRTVRWDAHPLILKCMKCSAVHLSVVSLLTPLSLLSFPDDSPLSSSQQLQSCPDNGALDPFPAQNVTSPNAQRGTLDTVQSPSQPQTQVQPQTPSQSFPYPQPAPHHQTHPQTHTYSQGQPFSQLQPQPQAQSQNLPPSQTNPHSQPQALPPAQCRHRHSKSTSSGSLSPRASSPHLSCSWARGVSRPPSVLLPRALYDIITASDSSGLPRCTSFLPHMSVAWASSFRYKHCMVNDYWYNSQVIIG